jgi:hypothetical protein
MVSDKLNFLQVQLIPILRSADVTTPPKWGKMSFQHMVEHLVFVLKNANGKIRVEEFKTPVEHLPAYQEFVMSDKEFHENTKSPMMPEDLYPLRYSSPQEVINKLEKEINDFVAVYESTPGLKVRNPIFGDLDYELAIRLHYKHAIHHLKQFGLI